MKTPCPHCSTPVDWDKKPKWRPFCSERCRMIDLGEWLSEEKAIPGEPADVPEQLPREDEN
ncbi:MAG: DNA gyrase inhibitor YacG [Gammaproteobacteria bacterium]|nr:DNA gyrase inhibitor YacG [Gammaproteobacteria bacterium]